MRGDIHRLKAPKGARGHEQAGARFAVVVQSDDLLALSTWLVAPTSTSASDSSFRPRLDVMGQSTLVLVEQTAAVDPSRLGEKVGHLSYEDLREVDSALHMVLGI